MSVTMSSAAIREQGGDSLRATGSRSAAGWTPVDATDPRRLQSDVSGDRAIEFGQWPDSFSEQRPAAPEPQPELPKEVRVMPDRPTRTELDLHARRVAHESVLLEALEESTRRRVHFLQRLDPWSPIERHIARARREAEEAARWAEEVGKAASAASRRSRWHLPQLWHRGRPQVATSS
jgi:hypothetical protein